MYWRKRGRRGDRPGGPSYQARPLSPPGVGYNDVNMKFAVIVDYNPDDPKVPVVRPAHREYLTGLRANGKLAISGPFTEGGGALIVLEADSKEQAAALMDARSLRERRRVQVLGNPAVKSGFH